MRPEAARPVRAATRLATTAAAVAAACAAFQTHAQVQGGQDAAGVGTPNNRIVTHVDARVTASDNVGLSSTNRESGLVFEVQPGVDWRYHSAHTDARVAANARAATSTTDAGGNSTDINLDGAVTTALYERTLFLDATARVAQQNPFNFFLPTGTADVNDVQRQVRSLSLSPYARGQLGTLDYETRYRVANTSGSDSSLDNATTNAVSGFIGRSAREGRRYDWGLSANYEKTDFRDFADYETAQWLLTLGLRATPTVRVFVDGGQERNGFRTDENPTNAIYDFGFEWNPTVRTRVRASYGKRFFGHNYSLEASHRFRLGTVELVRSRALTNSRNELFVPFAGTVSEGLDQALLSRYPDAGERALIIDRLIDQYNLPSIVLGPFALLTNRFYVETRTTARATLVGVRNVVTLSGYRADAMATDSATASDEFAFFGRKLRQSGLALDWRYKLDGRTGLGATYNYLRSEAVEAPVEFKTTAFSVDVTRRIGARTSTGLTYRRYDRETVGSSERVRENALIGSVRIQF